VARPAREPAIARRRIALPAGAVPAELPASLAPELATLVDKPLPGDWIYEIKFDGYRMLARIGAPGDVRIVTRRGNDWTHRFPSLRAALVAARLPPGWYDGEIVLLDESGKPSFGGLQNAIEASANDAIVFYLFDLPFCDGHDLRRVPVEERRALLQATLKETTWLRFSQEIGGDAAAILGSACKLGLEGVIGKRRGSIYVQRRSDDWIKLKCVQRQEFVIGGFTWPDDSRPAGIGALLVGQVDAAGKLQYAGKVGTGFTGEVSAALRQRLDAMAVKQRPFAGPTGHDRHATWVPPELVCEVTYNEWPEGGSLRHASFKGLREDKPAQAVERERPMHELVKVTHGSRVIDPSTGLTKLDVARYYAEVAPWVLPHGRRTSSARRWASRSRWCSSSIRKACAACAAPTRSCGPGTTRPSPSPRRKTWWRRRSWAWWNCTPGTPPPPPSSSRTASCSTSIRARACPGRRCRRQRCWCARCWTNWACAAGSRPAAARACTCSCRCARSMRTRR
jgi:bifunctional non-homologous end joining protein LigD